MGGNLRNRWNPTQTWGEHTKHHMVSSLILGSNQEAWSYTTPGQLKIMKIIESCDPEKGLRGLQHRLYEVSAQNLQCTYWVVIQVK